MGTAPLSIVGFGLPTLSSPSGLGFPFYWFCDVLATVPFSGVVLLSLLRQGDVCSPLPCSDLGTLFSLVGGFFFLAWPSFWCSASTFCSCGFRPRPLLVDDPRGGREPFFVDGLSRPLSFPRISLFSEILFLPPRVPFSPRRWVFKRKPVVPSEPPHQE